MCFPPPNHKTWLWLSSNCSNLIPCICRDWAFL